MAILSNKGKLKDITNFTYLHKEESDYNGIRVMNNDPKRCPLCGGPMENGLCLECGYDTELDGDLSFGASKPKKKEEGLFVLLLGDSSDSPF